MNLRFKQRVSCGLRQFGRRARDCEVISFCVPDDEKAFPPVEHIFLLMHRAGRYAKLIESQRHVFFGILVTVTRDGRACFVVCEVCLLRLARESAARGLVQVAFRWIAVDDAQRGEPTQIAGSKASSHSICFVGRPTRARFVTSNKGHAKRSREAPAFTRS